MEVRVRIVVTGGGGFIGSHVVEGLIVAGHEVIVVDDLTHGRRANVPIGAHFVQMDIRDPAFLDLLVELRPDLVNHHAAQVAVQVSIDRPIFDAEVNILGSLHLLEACRAGGVSKVIYSSSGGAAVGEPEYLPVDEAHAVAPLSPYGISKHTVEHYLRYYWLTHALRYTVLRYANVYGPRQDPTGEAGVVAIFAQRMLADAPVTIHGNGEQTRDFVYVDDIVQANLLAIDLGDGGLYHLGSGTETSINTIFRQLASATGYQRMPDYGPPLPGEVRRISLDTTRATHELGWYAAVPLDVGIFRTVEALQNQSKYRDFPNG
jgi:UDP-glucose 4-epimerase